MNQADQPATIRATPSRRRGRWRLYLLLALLLAGTVGAVWWRMHGAVAVTIIQPWRGPAIEAVYATGLVEAVATARVGTTVAGRIVSLFVDEGARVRNGEILAQLDDAQARHRLSDAQVRLALAAERNVSTTLIHVWTAPRMQEKK